MSDVNMDWTKIIKVKKPVKRVQRAVSFNESNLKALSAITEFINASSISDTLDQLIETYIQFGEISDLEGNIVKVKDIVNNAKHDH